MWTVDYNHKTSRYYLQNSKTGERRIVPPLTQREIDTKRYQQYFDKAYVKCEYLNGRTVYHTRIINGKKFMYIMRKQKTSGENN